jgi:prevent-host-death family protein
MADIVGVAEAKKRLSELMSRVAYRRERFLIHRRGRPAVALVSVEDLAQLEREPGVPPRGLLAVVGAWDGFDDLGQVLDDIYRQRDNAPDRPVSLEP